METPRIEHDTAHFYFDPACPWSWRTAQWIQHVRQQRPVQVEWELFSLEYVNRAQTDSPLLGQLRRNRPALRLLELARQDAGNEAVGRLYEALGRARHERKEDLGDADVLRQALEVARLDAGLLARAERDDGLDAQLQQQYEAAEAAGVFGVPTIRFGASGGAFFGPVIDAVPDGDEAVALWQDLSRIATRPYFLELKRAR